MDVKRALAKAALGAGIAAGGFLGALTAAEYRPKGEEKLPVTKTGEGSGRAAKEGETLTLLTWNIGFGCFDAGADFFKDGGTKQSFSRRRIRGAFAPMGSMRSLPLRLPLQKEEILSTPPLQRTSMSYLCPIPCRPSATWRAASSPSAAWSRKERCGCPSPARFAGRCAPAT